MKINASLMQALSESSKKGGIVESSYGNNEANSLRADKVSSLVKFLEISNF